MEKSHNRKKILYVIHADFRSDSANHVGGTQYHLKDLVCHVQEEFDVYVLARNEEELQLTTYREGKIVDTEYYTVGKAPKIPVLHDENFYQIYQQILDEKQIDIVHIQHLLDMTLDMPRVASEKDVPVYLTLHDFYYICLNEKLLDAQGIYDEQRVREHQVWQCLEGMDGIWEPKQFQEQWEFNCEEMLKKCTKLVTPSQSAKEIYSMYYPSLASKIEVIPHGYEMNETDVKQKDVFGKFHRKVKGMGAWDCVLDEVQKNNIAGWFAIPKMDTKQLEYYIQIRDTKGTIKYYRADKEDREDVATSVGEESLRNSGFRLCVCTDEFAEGKLRIRLLVRTDKRYVRGLKDVVIENHPPKMQKDKLNVAWIGGMAPAKGSKVAKEVIARMPQMNWYIFGNLGDEELVEMQAPNLFRYGNYQREELPKLMKKYNIDVVCLMSVWPETFCYTLSEAWLSGIPVIVNGLGAPKERVEGQSFGYIVDSKKPVEDLIEKVTELSEHTEKLLACKEKLANYSERSIQEMCQDYIDMYRSNFC